MGSEDLASREGRLEFPPAVRVVQLGRPGAWWVDRDRHSWGRGKKIKACLPPDHSHPWRPGLACQVHALSPLISRKSHAREVRTVGTGLPCPIPHFVWPWLLFSCFPLTWLDIRTGLG